MGALYRTLQRTLACTMLVIKPICIPGRLIPMSLVVLTYCRGPREATDVLLFVEALLLHLGHALADAQGTGDAGGDMK